ncbi:MAG: translocation/assembly module TamB domain-containing protein [Alishewanella aestuarii]
MKRLLTWLDRGIFWPLWALLLLLCWLLFSQSGLRFSLYLTEKAVPELKVAEASGSWLGGVTLHQLSYQSPELDLSLEQLQLRLQKRCLIQFRLCIPELALNGVTINSQSSDQSSAQAATAAEPALDSEPTTLHIGASEANAPRRLAGLAFPIPLKVDRLLIERLQLNLPEQQLAWQHFSIGLNAWGNRLQLQQGRLDGLAITLAESRDDAEPLTAYPAPELSPFSLPLSVFIDDFQLSHSELQQGEQLFSLPLLTFSAQLTPRQVRLLDLQLTHPQLQAQLSANLDLATGFPLSAQFDALLQDTALAGQRLQGQLRGSLAELIAEINASGPLNLAVQGRLALLSADLPLQLTLQARELHWPLAQPDYQLSALALELDGNLTELQLSLATELQATGLPDAGLRLDASWFNWQQRAAIRELQLTTLDGQVQAKGELNLEPALNWQLQLAMDGIKPGAYWPDYQGQLSGQLQMAGKLDPNSGLALQLPQLAMQGELRQLPLLLAGSLTLSSNADFSDWQFNSPDLLLSHGQNQLRLYGQLQQDWQLQAELSVPDAALSYPELRGALQGSIAVTGPMLTPKVTLELSAERLAYQDARLRQASLIATTDLADKLRTSLTLQLSQARWQQQRLQELQLSLEGDEDVHQLKAQLKAEGLAVKLQAAGSLSQRQLWQGQLTELLLASQLGDWQLAEPLAIKADLPAQQLMLAAHCWAQLDARLCLSKAATLSATQVQAKLALSDYPLENLNSLLPLQSSINGELAAQLDINWRHGQAPQLTFGLQSSSGQVLQQLDVPVTLPWRDLELSAEMAAHQLRSKLTLQLADSGQLTAQALVTELDQAEKPLRAELALTSLTLDFLKPLLDEYSELAGTLSSQLSLDGSLDNPQLHGELRLDGLKVRGKLAPTDIEQADLVISFRGERAELNGLVRTPEGKIDLAGFADWRNLDAWQANLGISGDPLRLQIPQAELFVQPNLLINAEPGRSRLTGTLQIPRANISVNTLPQNAIGLSSDHVLLDRRLQPITEEQSSQFTLETDIRVRLGQQVRLEAFGLKSRLAGELRVQQQQFNPSVRGEVSLVDGTFRAYGQDLLIRQGKLTFNGPADQPFLNVEAIRNPANMEDDVIAGIRVTGPADEPIVTIFSEPAKPQANALSYLIMGKDLDSESGFNANSVTTSLIGMSISSSGKLVGEIGEAFGVSDLMLDTEGAGDNSQVTVSGYLTRDLQLKYGIGIFQPIGQFTLRYRLMRNLYLEAVSGLDNAVDLLYKFEFD